MKPVWKEEHPIRLCFLGFILALVYLTILVPSGFLESARLESFDASLRWLHRVSAPPDELQRILLVTVDEESQRQMGLKWPWDRKVFAEFLNRLTVFNPRLILMDFAFVGASDPSSDEAFARSLQSGTPILLASYIDRTGDPVLPYTLFQEAGALTGLINKPRDSDHAVRRLWAMVWLPGRPEPLYAIEMKAAAMDKGLPIGSLKVPLEPPGAMAIHYSVTPAQIPTVPFWKVVQGKIRPEEIRDKLILVGSTREITHDVHPTPLGLMPGVAISANGLLTLLTGRFVRPLPPWVTFLGILGLILGILLSVYGSSLLRGLVVTVSLTAVAVGIALFLVSLNFRVESLSILLMAASAWLLGFIYKHLLLLTQALQLYRQVISDPVSGLFTPRYFRLRLRAMGSSGGILILKTALPSDILQDQPLEAAHRQIRFIADALRNASSQGALAGRLAEDLFALFLPKATLSKAKASAEKLQDSLRSRPGMFALGVASTEQGSFSSAEDLLRAAERAALRAWEKGRGALEVYDPLQDKLSLKPEVSSRKTQSSYLDYVASELEERNRILEKALAELRQAHGQLRSAFLEVTKSLILALETKDAYTAGHLERVSHYATRLAESLELPPEEIEAVREAALLHDIGKIGLPEEVLHKVGKLTDAEREIIKQHLEIGAKILEPMKFFKSITTLITHHHEWYNGQGYPHGLAGDFIPSGAQVITIADSYDAMTTHRGYNTPLTAQEAIAELKRGANAQFNPLYVEKFSELIAREGPHLGGNASA